MAKQDFVVTSPALKGAKIDTKASSLIWDNGPFANADMAQEASDEYREELAQGIDGVLGSAEDGVPARYRIRVKELKHSLGLAFAPCFVILTMFGCPKGYERAVVEVDLEVDGQVYSAAAESTNATFLYTATLRDKPLARAVVKAMRQIDAQAAAGADEAAAGADEAAAGEGEETEESP
jgi:hypothetical protein